MNKILPTGDVEEFTAKAVRKLLTTPAITAFTVHKLSAAGIPLDTAQQALKTSINSGIICILMNNKRL